jgi:hypothetical protein
MCTADAGRTSYGSSYVVFVMFVTFQPKLKKSDNFSKKLRDIKFYKHLFNGPTITRVHTEERTEGQRDSDRH